MVPLAQIPRIIHLGQKKPKVSVNIPPHFYVGELQIATLKIKMTLVFLRAPVDFLAGNLYTSYISKNFYIKVSFF